MNKALYFLIIFLSPILLFGQEFISNNKNFDKNKPLNITSQKVIIYRDKEEAIREYRSQLNHVAYDWGSLGLNRFRGMLNHCSYAEAYYIHKPKYDLFIEFLKKNKDRILED